MKHIWNILFNFLKNTNMANNKTIKAKNLTIQNINDVVYDNRDCKYYYKVGTKKYLLDPHSMIIRGCDKNPNAPIVYFNSNDKKMRNGSNGVHPVRRWYSDTYKENYSYAREITVARWCKLSDERKQFALR